MAASSFSGHALSLPARQHGHAAQVAFVLAGQLARNCADDPATFVGCYQNCHFGKTRRNRFCRVAECFGSVAAAIWLEGLSQTVQNAGRVFGCGMANGD